MIARKTRRVQPCFECNQKHLKKRDKRGVQSGDTEVNDRSSSEVKNGRRDPEGAVADRRDRRGRHLNAWHKTGDA